MNSSSKTTPAPVSVHVCLGHTFSGLESWVVDIVAFQVKQGLDVSLLARAGSPVGAEAKSRGLTVFECELPIGLKTVNAALEKVYEAKKFNILHTQGSREFKLSIPWIAYAKLVRRVPLRVIIQFHIWLSHSKRGPLHWISHRLIDEIWCSSRLAAEAIYQNLPISRDRIFEAHYGRDVATIEREFMTREQARQEMGIPNDAIVIGSVSRIDKGKGTGELLDACVEKMKTHEKLHLVIIGSPTDDPKAKAFAQKLSDSIQKLPTEQSSRIHLMGFHKKAYRFLKGFDLFALPTYSECFALALIEAQIAGLPALATNSGGSPELVKEGKTGWLCEPQSTRSLADAIDRAIAQKEKWHEMGEVARLRARVEYEYNHALQQTLRGYTRILQNVEPAL